MGIIEWIYAGGWFVFSNTHCDELEKKSAAVLKKTETLLVQAEEHGFLFLQEKNRLEVVHKTLEELAQSAKAIEEKTVGVLPVLSARSAVHANNLQEIQRIAVLSLMPAEVVILKKELDESLKSLEESRNMLNATFQAFKNEVDDANSK